MLRQFAQLLQENTRESDVCCRYGGEEMAIILPETGLDEATLLAHKLCRLVRQQAFTGTTEQTLKVTTSVGVAAFEERWENPEAMVNAADEALYEAKRNGRDRVEVSD